MEFGSLLLVGTLVASLFGAGMLAMAVGTMFKHDSLRGSCGGPPRRDANGTPISCGHCSNRAKPDNAHATAAKPCQCAGTCSHEDRPALPAHVRE